MVGSIGEILTAFAAVILLAGFLRYTFGSGPKGALPSEGGDVGLLETVATVPTREAAEVLAARLAREKVRATIAHGSRGWDLLVFPGDADDARVVLRM
ncbi:hypothetical protein GCM10023201_40540 [Actinomycetospora corticicola]|uniref:Uncharacterized protein n=1 Tax=Actinomycetospora corticicola TaxID=663602 RepID=A0A7Y9J641_9PSEU|nr:hypothetical protein [Actinomycetospora corticicola]NYD36862.1 hypothetical protein [Actinomycetospora corticicola]